MHKPLRHAATRRHCDFELLTDAVVAEDRGCADAACTPVVEQGVAPLDDVGHIRGGFVFGVNEVDGAG